MKEGKIGVTGRGPVKRGRRVSRDPVPNGPSSGPGDIGVSHVLGTGPLWGWLTRVRGGIPLGAPTVEESCNQGGFVGCRSITKGTLRVDRVGWSRSQ